jgi:uracil-DNA glycosylase
MFTGDSSGNWLYRALYRAGFANQPSSDNKGDGLTLKDCYISAVAHCAPPGNKPLPEELKNCRHYLVREVECLTQVKVVVALGRIAFDAAIALIGRPAGGESEAKPRSRRPAFSHGAAIELQGGITLIASYHPSQQNTFTGKLTEAMLDSIFSLARSKLELPNRARSLRASSLRAR